MTDQQTETHETNTMREDQARGVRAGEELSETLLPYLRAEVPALADGVEVEQFPSGHSNLTYLLRGVGAHDTSEFVLRRPPFGAQAGHDMAREHRILRDLYSVWPKVPRPVLFCDDADVLDAPFYVMERVRGVILRGPAHRQPTLDPALMGDVCDALVQTLVAIHDADLDASGLRALGRPEGYVRRQVEGWTRRLDRAKTEPLPELDFVSSWLQENLPPETDATLIHNDYKYDNLVLNPDDLTDVRAVLDWEMATVGDPLMDLGTTLAYWIDPEDPKPLQALRFGPTTDPGNLNRAALVARYAELSGRDVSDAVFYYAYGLFKVAGIAQQIYWRFANGYTKDPRFAGLIHAVKAMGTTAKLAIERQSLTPYRP